MKVQLTIEIAEDERIGIAAIVASEFRPASRVECRDWASGILEGALNPIGDEVSAQRDALILALTPPVLTADGQPIKV